jgi:MFS transporter, FSR family, fosmidomycin resistance protein
LELVMPASRTSATLGFLAVAHAFSHLLMLLYPTAVLAMEGVFGLSYAELLPLSVAGYILFGAAALPMGWLGDRWSSARMMVLFFLGTGAATVWIGLATGPWSLLAALTVMGLFAAIYHPVAIAWVASVPERPGKALGINGIFGSFGVAAGPLLAGLLADFVHWRAAFIVPGVLCVLTGVAFAVLLRRGWLVMGQITASPRAAREDGGAGLRPLYFMFVAMICTGLIFQISSIGMPKIFQDRLGDVIGGGAATAGGLVSAIFLLSAVGHIIAGALADRLPQRRLYASVFLLQALLLAVAATTFHPLLVIVVFLAVTLNTGNSVVENLLLARYTPPAWRGRAYGVKFVLSLGLGGLGVPLIALIYGQTGSFTGVFVAMAAFALAGCVLGLSLPRRDRGGRTEAVQPAE